MAQITKNAITLKGSAKLLTDYLNFSINSILYQRGIYPTESFIAKTQFGLPIYMSTDEKLNEFVNNVLEQIRDWLLAEKLKKMSLVILNTTNKEVIERWDFKVEYQAPKDKSAEAEVTGGKDLKVIQKEIRDVLKQICCSVTILPLIDVPCCFDLLTYTMSDAEVPEKWGESGPCIITNSQEVQFRKFSTSLHKMETAVSYKFEES